VGEQILPGMCFTIEPMINVGTHRTKLLKDGWTVITADKLLSAQFEHTITVTESCVEIMTE
jgi:methionyl aminopeptidase